MSGAIADAFVVAWKTKYEHGLWRPVTAIRLAAEDGNEATAPDPTWEPLIATPPFPCYISGHAIASGAAERALALALGSDRLTFHVTNPEVGVTRAYSRFPELARESVEVRIWSGVHFRVSQEEGIKAGRRIGETCARGRLQRIAPTAAGCGSVPAR